MIASWTRSKTTGSDRNVGSRTSIIVVLCRDVNDWWKVGHSSKLPQITQEIVCCCLHAELRSDSAFALQNRELFSLQVEKTPICTWISTTFWTPNSSRTFMHSGTNEEERRDVGGRSAQGSDTFSRVASRVISNLHHELSAARKAWRASLSGDLLTLFGSWDFPLFQRLLDEATRTNTCCTTPPASLSSVLRLFLAYCHPNLCTQPFLCPSFGQMFLNVMLNYSTASAPPVTPSWIVAQDTKPTKNFFLALWTDHTTPLKSALGSTKS